MSIIFHTIDTGKQNCDCKIIVRDALLSLLKRLVYSFFFLERSLGISSITVPACRFSAASVCSFFGKVPSANRNFCLLAGKLPEFATRM